MISRCLIRRLEKLERLRPNPIPFFRVEFYRMNENGTLIQLDRGDDGSNDARDRIRVVFVNPVTNKKARP